MQSCLGEMNFNEDGSLNTKFKPGGISILSKLVQFYEQRQLYEPEKYCTPAELFRYNQAKEWEQCNINDRAVLKHRFEKAAELEIEENKKEDERILIDMSKLSVTN